ncbi:MAG: glucose-6-phosphate dehydrogenase [Candidatus Sumerlaeota bacterium]
MKAQQTHRPLSILVVGASGDLARSKIFPALFSLDCQNYLPEGTRMVGLSRTEMSCEDYREKLGETLTCRYLPEKNCEEKMKDFLSRVHYVPGDYDNPDCFLEAYKILKQYEGDTPANRLYYLSIPPFLFLTVANTLAAAGLVQCGEKGEPWSRVVIEKPFGKDRESSDDLADHLADVFTEDQTYRIDHYLGKEVIQNLMVLRFANRIFEPIWNREHVRSVRSFFREDKGVEGRGGYFDEYGIVRDVLQNHLLQILSLLAMEQPRNLEAHAIRDAKVAVLRHIAPPSLGRTVLGQYTAGNGHEAYIDDKTVPGDSRTPTFAATILEIDNDRWRGVPFYLSAGKGLDRKSTDIHVDFRPPEQPLYQLPAIPLANRLRIRVQPDESIQWDFINRVPGLGGRLAKSTLDMHYASTFNETVPEAYESLILDAIRGDKALFIRRDELEAAWDIFTPVLHAFEGNGFEPEPYPFGSTGPEKARELAEKMGILADEA